MAKKAAEFGQKISLEALLSEQKRQQLTGTIEEVAGDPKKVKITPWLPGGACMCQYAMNVPKSAIDSVMLTPHQHPCCGKMLRVVEISFKAAHSVSLEDVFGQLLSKAMEEEHMARQISPGGSWGADGDKKAPRCFEIYERCLEQCKQESKKRPRGLTDKATCYNFCGLEFDLCKSRRSDIY
jgi:hypothetical protein